MLNLDKANLDKRIFFVQKMFIIVIIVLFSHKKRFIFTIYICRMKDPIPFFLTAIEYTNRRT